MVYNNEWFIKRAREVHGDKYDYSKVEYVNTDTKVCIICPKHGEFWQTPYNHFNSKVGCPRCSFEKNANGKRKNTEQFIEKAREVHGDKYDYSKVNYVNNRTKVCIICHEKDKFGVEHGEFWQTPWHHLKGEKCPKCVGKYIKSFKDFLYQSKQIHDDKYDYSKVNYVNTNIKVCIICPEHGEFWQTPECHVNRKQGCPVCGIKHQVKKRTLVLNDFIKRSNNIHNNKYDYSLVSFNNCKDKVDIICPTHGIFKQEVWGHLAGYGCPRCSIHESKSEQELFNLVKTNCPDTLNRVRNIIPPKEIDIYIPSKKIGIEYHGLHWHSELYNKDKKYHYDKLKSCKEKGIKLIQIFEDEYIEHKDIVLSKIKHIIGCNKDKPKIFGRKCTIKEITNKVTKDFLDKYHIQGFVGSTIYLGAYYEDKLIGVMTFKRELKNNNKWELTRFASDYNYVCCGVGGKLFKYFVKNYNPTEIKSFADRRWTIDEENNIYLQLGFKFDSYTSPDYRYFNPHDGLIRQHKFGFRKQILHNKYDLSLSMTESEMVHKLGYYKIWDCGLIKYIWNI